MRLRGPYQSSVHPGKCRRHREGGMLLCDKGARADKHECVKCFKDELNADVKVGFEGREEKTDGFTETDADKCCAKSCGDVFIS